MVKKDIKKKIQEYFLQNPTVRLRVRQIEREVNVPLPSVIRYVKELEEEKILRKSKIANIILYSSARNSPHYKLAKTLFNINSLFFSNLIPHIVQDLSNPTIVLFGSYSKGEDIETSDIDLYIETKSKKNINIKKFEKILQRNIQLFIHSNIHLIKNKDLANNIVNGTTINGFMEVFK